MVFTAETVQRLCLGYKAPEAAMDVFPSCMGKDALNRCLLAKQSGGTDKLQLARNAEGNYNCFRVGLAEGILEAAFCPIVTVYVYIAYLFHEGLLNPAACCGCDYMGTICVTPPRAECTSCTIGFKIMEHCVLKTEQCF